MRFVIKVLYRALQARTQEFLRKFMKIRARILKSFQRLNYTQTLPRASPKNNYLYQILIV